MAELGSHQLDACSIFLGKAKPLAVSAVGGKMFYTDDPQPGGQKGRDSAEAQVPQNAKARA